MNLHEIYSSDKSLNISFEVFPEDNVENLYNTINVLKKYNPKMVSLTYGAGGKNRDFSLDIIKHLTCQNMNVMPHFTCICNSKEIVKNNLKSIKDLKIENILALRGDIPDDRTLCCYDFKYASELVQYIKENNSEFSIGVAGYPEGHIECDDINSDLKHLKEKIDKGANAIFTQLFFDNSKFFNYVEQVRNLGLKIPIVAGIMPILSAKQINKMTSLARINVPKEILNAMDKYTNLQEFGIEFAVKQCQELIDNEMMNLHFFTLNKHYSVSHILDNIL